MSCREPERLPRLWSACGHRRLAAILGMLLLFGSPGWGHAQNILVTTIKDGSTGGSPAQVTVTVFPEPTGAVSVNFATSDGAGTDAAMAAKDYQPNNGTLVFGPGVASQTIDVV